MACTLGDTWQVREVVIEFGPIAYATLLPLVSLASVVLCGPREDDDGDEPPPRTRLGMAGRRAMARLRRVAMATRATVKFDRSRPVPPEPAPRGPRYLLANIVLIVVIGAMIGGLAWLVAVAGSLPGAYAAVLGDTSSSELAIDLVPMLYVTILPMLFCLHAAISPPPAPVADEESGEARPKGLGARVRRRVEKMGRAGSAIRATVRMSTRPAPGALV